MAKSREPDSRARAAQRYKAWREANPEKYVRIRLVAQAKYRAKKKGIPFNLTADDISLPTHCPVLGIPILVSSTRGNCPNSPSLDRIIPAKGYTKGNVIVVSMRANMIKSNAKPEDIFKVAQFYEAIMNKTKARK